MESQLISEGRGNFTKEMRGKSFITLYCSLSEVMTEKYEKYNYL